MVDVIEEEAHKNLPKFDVKTHNQFKLLAKEILCGLYLKESDIMNWFPKFGTFKKGCMTNKEFFSAVDALDATLVFEKTAETLI